MLRFSSVLILMIFSTLFAQGANQKVEFTVNDLRCENLYEPLGIGTYSPALSWKTQSSVNGTTQKAYQIIVASSPELLNEKKADLWNTGKILSSESVLVTYNGKKLHSRSLCYWKVRIWNESDQVSEWSDHSSFSVGLIEKSDWKAEYIGFPVESENCVSPQLRVSFTINNKYDRIFLNVNSLGYHEVWLNGRKVSENVLVPAVVQFDKRSQIITYDISRLVQKGKNDIIIWIAQGWYSKGLPGVVNGGPFVRAQIEKLAKGNWETVLVTDSQWTGRNSGYSTIGTWRPHQFGGEKVDGSVILPDMSTASLNAVSWNPVKVIRIPFGEATPQACEPNRIMETLKAKTITQISDSVWLADLGTTLTGQCSISFPRLKKGQEIVIEYCDHLEKDGNAANQGQIDRYIASGKESETFSNKFNYHGFRYIKISNLATKPELNDLTATLIHTNYNIASSFECSDPDLNKIHDMVFYTLKCLSLGGYLIDCPQIERLGYGGDGNASTLTAQTMFDLAPLYKNWLQAWADCIREDGSMPHTAPNPYSAGGGPFWCGFIITASWKAYQNYGDIRFLKEYYPVMQKWLGYVESYSPSGLLEPWPETSYRSWYLGDWATPVGIDQTAKASVNLVNNCFITVCYETMEKIAGILGHTTDMENYSAIKISLREKIQDKFFDSKQRTYGTGTQIDMVYPMLSGVVPDSLAKSIYENFRKRTEINYSGHLATGLVGIPVVTEWAVKNHEPELMYSMLKKKDYPGYLYMLENGASTTWEHWNGERSRIHNCYNGIGSWFYQAIGGIRPDEENPGYRHIFIDPQIPEGITWANTSKVTPYGKVSVNWKTENNLMKMKIRIPVGSTASVRIPDGNDSIILNGENVNSKQPYTEINSGEYTIEYKLNR